MRVLIFGAGYSGQAFAHEIAGGPGSVIGTTRAPDKADALRRSGIEPLVFAGAVSPELSAAIRQATHIVVSAAPDADGDPVLNAAGPLIERAPALRWIGYLSTVGVYGDQDGRWTTEETPVAPNSVRSRERVEAEAAWMALGRRIARPVAILRLSGIYGPGRNAFVNLRAGAAKRIVKPGQVFNRIHVDDIAGSLAHLAKREVGGIFNITDDLPAPPQDVVAYAAGLMGTEPPPETPFEAAEMSDMARSFYAECKRVSNARIRAAGYGFRQPDYRAALDSMWRDGTWMRGAPRSAIKVQ